MDACCRSGGQSARPLSARPDYRGHPGYDCWPAWRITVSARRAFVHDCARRHSARRRDRRMLGLPHPAGHEFCQAGRRRYRCLRCRHHPDDRNCVRCRDRRPGGQHGRPCTGNNAGSHQKRGVLGAGHFRACNIRRWRGRLQTHPARTCRDSPHLKGLPQFKHLP